MASYLFSSQESIVTNDDPHLQISVTPSASAFYAGETFSVTISFRNTRSAVGSSSRVSSHDPTSEPSFLQTPSPEPPHIELPRRIGQIGRKPENAEAGPSRSPLPLQLASPAPITDRSFPYSPGSNPLYRAPGWPTHDNSPIRSPDGWDRDSPGSGHVRRARSLALGKGGMSPQELVWALSDPPPLPKRPNSAGIPKSHPHSRKVSINKMSSSPPSAVSALPSPQLESIQEGSPENSQAGPSRPPPRPGKPHGRTPSYHNAYGASFLGVQPPPRHPSQAKVDTHTTILWAHTRLVAHFSPSNAYIPPDPLLPLRSLLLHQPVGSGSLNSPEPGMKSSSSRWQLSFGTGTIGASTQPSLTGSLFGLAKSVVYGGSGGSLEEERKRVWNMKDLPVLETGRSLLGVDIKLKEGESRDFIYTLKLPTTLPPAHRGKAFKFSYDLVISLNVALPGAGKRQRTKDITVPIRVWANVSLSQPIRTYDVLQPIIQTKDEGKVDAEIHRRSSIQPKEDTLDSLRDYARHLLDTVDDPKSPHTPVPDSPTKLTVPKALRPRKGSFIAGDDELVEEGNEGCGEAVEILSRHSPKTSYDISKDGDLVAVLTLIKTIYRLGETVLGVVTFNTPVSQRQVIKFSAYLESNELIPPTLLPPSASSSGPTKQPPLSRTHAEHRMAYCHQTRQTSFALDIPSDGTPAFSLSAGGEGGGGLEWRLKLVFLATVPKRRSRPPHARSLSSSSMDSGSDASGRSHVGVSKKKGVRGHTVIPAEGSPLDHDNDLQIASQILTPLIPVTKNSSSSRTGSHQSLMQGLDRSRSGGDHAGNGYGSGSGKGNGNGNGNSNNNGNGHLARKESRQIGWLESKLETVECEIPIKVLAGNTAFVVRPLVYTV